MMIAAKLGFLTLVEMLYMHGADVERVNNVGDASNWLQFNQYNLIGVVIVIVNRMDILHYLWRSSKAITT